MDDGLLKRADRILTESRATRADVRECRLRARLEVARIRVEVLIARAERVRSRRLCSEMADMAEVAVPQGPAGR